jgi:hypothetical protein
MQIRQQLDIFDFSIRELPRALFGEKGIFSPGIAHIMQLLLCKL